jgi:hypothetical protein
MNRLAKWYFNALPSNHAIASPEVEQTQQLRQRTTEKFDSVNRLMDETLSKLARQKIAHDKGSQK